MSIQLKQKEMDLYHRYQMGDESAKKELLKSLTPLISNQVNKFSTSGLPVSAIQMEGQRLTLEAFKTYDPNRSQLNTHVTNHLKKLSRFVTNYQNVGYIPEPRALMIGKYNTVFSNLEADKGREPTAQELADAMHVSVAEIERLQSELRKDLSDTMTADDEDDLGVFFQYIRPESQNPKLKEALEFVYFEADPIDKKIMENTIGMYGNTIKSGKDLALMLNMTEAELKKHKDSIASEVKELM